jgi:hypothetical protein
VRTLPTFQQLWLSYPATNSPCDRGYENQCAIRLSVALVGAGFPLTGYAEPLCPHGHARGAESLARYLSRVASSPVRGQGATIRMLANARRCILLFQNIEGFRGGRGDHIDLWDGTRSKSGAYFGECQQVWLWNLA